MINQAPASTGKPAACAADPIWVCQKNPTPAHRCQDFTTCPNPCQAGRLGILIRAAIKDGMDLGAALRVVYTAAFEGGYPGDDPYMDKAYIDLVAKVGIFDARTKEVAFLDSLPPGFVDED